MFSEAIECCRRAADPELITLSVSGAAVAAVNAADAAWQCGDVEALAAHLDYATAIVERLPESRFLAAFVQNRGRLLRCRRAFDASVRDLERASELNDRTARWENAVEVLDDLALTFLGGGRLTEAMEALTRGTEMLQGRARPYAIRHHWIDACVKRASGAADQARRALLLAHATYVERHNGLANPDLRMAFEAIPMHRALCAAVEFDEWPSSDSPCVVAFPAARTPG
jgi:tetratricopeptide (TPR) repeat protein